MAYMGWSDFRSDTVTRPTPEMRRAMAEAEVGDDVLGDDPTVLKLQDLAAAILGKEAALFVPSGTMGNTMALLTHRCRGKQVLLEEHCHIYKYEAGNISNLAGALPKPLTSVRGRMAGEDLQAAANNPADLHLAAAAGVCLENSHNYHGGAVLPLEYIEEVGRWARSRQLFLHLDGARIFNAATRLKIQASAIARPCDSVMFCLSKGLAAPVGSLLLGRKEFIAEAKRERKRLGGGMRQAGVLAAAGIIALQTMSQRLEEDHARARRLAEGIAGISGLTIDPDEVETNIVIFQVAAARLSTAALCEKLKELHVLALPFGAGRVRLVTHNDIDDADVQKALQALEKTMKSAG